MHKLSRIKLVRVRYVPKTLELGILYVSEEFGAAVHLCACGCGAKISTPLGPTEWTLSETASGPSVYPSIGNWQLPCKSHYWIWGGEVAWAEQWTPEQIATGQKAENQRRRDYYDSLDHERIGVLRRLWNWLRSLFR